jgi:hypothetical protein
MKYRIVDDKGIKVAEARSKQRLYAVWEDLMNLHRRDNSFDWAAGFSMRLRDGTFLEAMSSKGEVPRYNRNEWKQNSSIINGI